MFIETRFPNLLSPVGAASVETHFEMTCEIPNLTPITQVATYLLT